MSTITRSGTFPMGLSAKRATPEPHLVSDMPPQPQRRSLKTMPPRPECTSSSDTDFPSILSLSTGSRVSVPSLDVIGTLRFLGTTQFKPGLWAGIELDAPGTGKNDGCVQGVRYFTCPPQSGLFIAASKIVPIKESARLSESRSTRTSTSATTRPRPQPTPSRSAKSTRSSITSHRRTPSISGETAPRKSVTKQKTPPPPLPIPTPDPMIELERELASAERRCKAHEEEIQRNNTKLNLIYDLLEKAEGDKERLARQIKDSEGVLEGLVSTKESYKLRVKECEDEMARLGRELAMANENSRDLQLAITEQELSLAQTTRDNSDFESSQRRIQQLERLVHELQDKSTLVQQQLQNTLKDHNGQIGQMRHELNAREEQVAHLEKECDEQEKACNTAVDAYEDLARRFKEQEDNWKEQKEMDMSKLMAEIEALRQSQLAVDDEGMQAHDMYEDEWHEQRLRLEQQLELTTNELDRGRQQVNTLRKESDGLRTELKRIKQTLSNSDERFESLQSQLNEEVQDKRRLIEEAESAFEAQTRAEDEAYSAKAELREARERISELEAGAPLHDNSAVALLEKKLQDAEQRKRELEQECNHLMDEMLVLEKANVDDGGASQGDDRALCVEVEKLKQELEQRKKQCNELEISKKTEVNKLRDELSRLEAMIESKVFNEGDLEDALEAERQKVNALEQQVAELQQQKKKKSSSKQRKQANVDLFCEICDVSGHDVFSCTAFSAAKEQAQHPPNTSATTAWLGDEESY